MTSKVFEVSKFKDGNKNFKGALKGVAIATKF